MVLASELLELLEQRYPDKMPLVEVGPFRQGENVGIQKIIQEIRTEIKNATVSPTKT